MSDTFENQKELLNSLKKETRLIQQQIDFLLRNEKEMQLLDLDVLMNRTHTLYDLLCSIDLGEPENDNEEVDMDADAFISNIFGNMSCGKEAKEESDTALQDEVTAPTIATEANESEPIKESIEQSRPTEEKDVFFRFEETGKDEVEQEHSITNPEIKERQSEQVQQTIAEKEHQPELVAQHTFINPIAVSEPITEKAHEPITNLGNDTSADNSNVHFSLNETMESPEVIGEKMQQAEDNSLAAKLQNKPLRDLKAAIGINDKFLFVNELFAGSMEKYNKSIENLNDIKTLNGALIYLNELKVELQWNSGNETYKKLSNLISRKFNA